MKKFHQTPFATLLILLFNVPCVLPYDNLSLYCYEDRFSQHISYDGVLCSFEVLETIEPNQASNLEFLRGMEKATLRDPIETLLQKGILEKALDPKTQFANYSAKGAFKTAWNPLNLTVTPAKLRATHLRADLEALVKQLVTTTVAKGRECHVEVSSITPNIWLVDIELTDQTLTLREALNWIGKKLAAGWTFRCLDVRTKGLWIELDLVTTGPREALPRLPSVEDIKLFSNETEFLLEAAMKGDSDHRRAAIEELLPRRISKQFSDKIRALAINLLSDKDRDVRREAVDDLYFFLNVPFPKPGEDDSVIRLFPDKGKTIEHLRLSSDFDSLLKLLKEGDALQKAMAAEELTGWIRNSRQFSTEQIAEIYDLIVAQINEKNPILLRSFVNSLQRISDLKW